MKLKSQLEEKLKNLPKNPGVYVYRDSKGKIIYIGKAKVLKNRVRSYFVSTHKKDAKTRNLVKKISDLEIIVTDNEVEALILEANLIYKHQPRYNILLKKDNSYPYIKITKEVYPRIFYTRNIVQDGSKYFGPYTNRHLLNSQLEVIKKIFKTRICHHKFDEKYLKKMTVPVCLEFHLNKCFGQCQAHISVEEEQENFRKITKFLNGHTREVILEMKEKMDSLAKKFAFEKAAEVRDYIAILENFSNKQKVVSNDFVDRDVIAISVEGDDACGVIFKVRSGKLLGRMHYYLANVLEKTEGEILETILEQYYLKADFIPQELMLSNDFEEGTETFAEWLSEKRGTKVKIVIPKIGEKSQLIEMTRKNAELLLNELKLKKLKNNDFVPRAISALQRDLHLENPPRRMECFDNSNIQGSDPVASMVVFVNGKPLKNDYRKFKIKTVVGPDDFASMFEIVTRRYKRVLEEKQKMPDLIVIDGGKGQLSSAVSALKNLGIENQPIIGLAKRLEEVFLPEHTDPQNIPRTSSGLKLLQQIRDEAHRFAITFHRDLRAKRMTHSKLDEIPGVGGKRKMALLQHFGSIKQIKEATPAEIQKIGRIPLKLAERILEEI